MRRLCFGVSCALGLLLPLGGCASKPEIVPSSGPRTPTSASQVKIYEKQPKKYEMLGTVTVTREEGAKWDEKGDANAAFDTAKSKAAALGANGLLLAAAVRRVRVPRHRRLPRQVLPGPGSRTARGGGGGDAGHLRSGGVALPAARRARWRVRRRCARRCAAVRSDASATRSGVASARRLFGGPRFQSTDPNRSEHAQHTCRGPLRRRRGRQHPQPGRRGPTGRRRAARRCRRLGCRRTPTR